MDKPEDLPQWCRSSASKSLVKRMIAPVVVTITAIVVVLQAALVEAVVFNRGTLYGLPEPSWSDVSTDHWAYTNIEEASKSHTYTIHPQGGEWWISH